ncbi:tetratricopeptide repeat protein [Telmatospirillum siberiense]|uniref:Uncharacterized protein n=1 Tax=Telmatospirillum siberiense TaxID=382514 RepID=A0A2N3Q1P5_9PROT|nr:tetratricopeptide repeat protein [Telmatospirillum siberiense]PKU26511.1 hypothetical protein CWS72_01310 [Telmatospirillum siberiense]
MSVLYKALERASKARETLRSDPMPTPRLPLMGGRPARRRRLPVALSAVAAGLAIAAGVFVLFGDDLLSGLDRVSAPSPKVPGSPRKLPTLAQQPPAVMPAVPDAAPAQVGEKAGALSPQAAAASVEPSQPAPVQPASIQAAPAPVVPAKPAPVSTAPALPVAGRAAAGRPKVVQADEDLPAVLDRIRRERMAPALAQGVTVDRRTATADLTGRDGASSIAVSVAAAPNHEDANTAYDMLMRGQYEGALGLYDKILKSSPRNVAALLGKGTAEHKLRRYGDARESYRRVLAIDPGNREALTNTTAIVADLAPDQALGELRVLQKNYPAFSPISAQIASIEARRDNLAAAILALGDAVAQSPDNGLYRLNLAILQDRAGDREAAVASYRQAVDLLGGASSLPVPLDQIRQRLRYLQGR